VRILKQTDQKLVFYHRQSGRWLAAGGWLLVCLGAIVGFSFKPEIAKRFIQNPSKTSFQIQSGALPVIDRPFFFVMGCMAIAIILQRVSTSLASEEIYIVRLNKEKDWVAVTRKQRSGKPQVAVTEFPVSAIASVNVDKNHLALKLKSGREIRIATAIWGKKTLVELIGEPPVEVHQAFNETQKEISSFLQI
jgi:hypothetical protein